MYVLVTQKCHYAHTIRDMLKCMTSNGELTKLLEQAINTSENCIPSPHRACMASPQQREAVHLIEQYDHDSQISQFLLSFAKNTANVSCTGNIFLRFMELVVVKLHQHMPNPNTYLSLYDALAPSSNTFNTADMDFMQLAPNTSQSSGSPVILTQTSSRGRSGSGSEATLPTSTPRISPSPSQDSRPSTPQLSRPSTPASQLSQDDADDIFQWNDASTRLLLDLYEDKKDELMRPCVHRCSVWRAIAATMNTYGYRVTGENCDKKFRNMKTTYRRIVDKKKLSGAGKPTHWPFFERMNDIMAGDPAVEPAATLSCLQVTELRPQQSYTPAPSAPPSTPTSAPATPVVRSIPSVSQTFDTSDPTPPQSPTVVAPLKVTIQEQTPTRQRKRRRSSTVSPPLSGSSVLEPPEWFLRSTQEERQHNNEQFQEMRTLQLRTITLQEERNTLLRELTCVMKEAISKTK